MTSLATSVAARRGARIAGKEHTMRAALARITCSKIHAHRARDNTRSTNKSVERPISTDVFE
jgi:hypothetical protein